jgi:hypothetical protein
VDVDRPQPEYRVSVRRHVAVALLLGAIAVGGASASASTAAHTGSGQSTLRLVCPLH